MIDETTKDPKTLPSDAPIPKRGTGRPRKPPATPKPKRHSAGADLWTNAARVHYLRITDAFRECIDAALAACSSRGLPTAPVFDVIAEELAVLGPGLTTKVAGVISRRLETLAGEASNSGSSRGVSRAE